MRAVARAHQTRDLAAFEQTLRDYREELSSDPTIRSHLAALYDTLLEQNLLRIVEPYSVVEIEYVAGQVRQGRQDVEAKYLFLFLSLCLCELTFGVPRDRLSQMILDKIFHGVLDQGRGCLLVFDEGETNVCCRTGPVLFIAQVTVGHVRHCDRHTRRSQQGRGLVVC